MPVRKFRDVSEMPESPWLEPGSAALMRTIARVWAFSARAFPRQFPPGVHKHRSIESLNSLTDAWERADQARLDARRAAAKVDLLHRAPEQELLPEQDAGGPKEVGVGLTLELVVRSD